MADEPRASVPSHREKSVFGYRTQKCSPSELRKTIFVPSRTKLRNPHQQMSQEAAPNVFRRLCFQRELVAEFVHDNLVKIEAVDIRHTAAQRCRLCVNGKFAESHSLNQEFLPLFLSPILTTVFEPWLSTSTPRKRRVILDGCKEVPNPPLCCTSIPPARSLW